MVRYYYTGTTADRLKGISELGLAPAVEHGEVTSFPNYTDPNYIYFTKNFKNAAHWARHIFEYSVMSAEVPISINLDTGKVTELGYRQMPVILRFPASAVTGKTECDPNFSPDENIRECAELRADATVPSNQIEVAGILVDTGRSDVRGANIRYEISGEWIPLSQINPEDVRAFTRIAPLRTERVRTVMRNNLPYEFREIFTKRPEKQYVVYGFAPAIERASKFMRRMQRIAEGNGRE